MILKSVRHNKIKTGFIITLFFIFITLFVYFLSRILFDDIYIAAAIGLSASIISAFTSYYNSDKMILHLNNARPATREEFLQLNVSLESLCIASGLPLPKLYVMDTPALNAFATGRNPKNAVVCVTTGLLNKLDKYELEGVMAHELSHIKNYDILLSTVISVFAGFIVMVADFVLRFGFFGRDSDDDRESNKLDIIIFIIGLIFLILSPIITKLIQLAVSRKREYLADATAVEFTRNPKGLISALKKLQADESQMRYVSNATAHMYINEPNKKQREKTNIFSTHPPLSERIARLENIN